MLLVRVVRSPAPNVPQDVYHAMQQDTVKTVLMIVIWMAVGGVLNVHILV